jgi:hypothetical protein
MSTRSHTLGAPRSVRTLLQHHPAAARKIPSPGREWRLADVAGEDRSLWLRLIHADAFERVGKAEPPSGNGQVHYYRTKRSVYQLAQELAREGPWPDCPHTGIVNLDGGETFTCGDDDCDARYGRETAREVFGE